MGAAPAPPQLTSRAIVLGITLAAILAGANAYLGLFAGLTVSASIPAAVISMGVLRLFRDSNVLENNIVQTAASAGESVAAGAIFTLPALILLGYWNVFDYAWVSAICGIGGLLGVLFTVPLRRSLIVEQALRYPEGTATAEVLRVGAAGGGGLKALAAAAGLGAAIKLCETGFKLWPAIAQGATTAGNSTVLYAGSNLSPALLGVGYIVGPNIASLVLTGGLISWAIAIPVFTTWFVPASATLPTDPVELAFHVWSTKVRYLGVGAMLTGGIWALISVRHSVLSGLRRGLAAGAEQAQTQQPAHTEQDMPMTWVYAGVALIVLPMLGIYYQVLGTWGLGAAMTVIMLIAGFLFSAVGGYMAGLVGSSNNPVSGITIATILFASLLLLWLSGAGTESAAAAILIGAVVCCAAAIAGDNLQDLKAGYILGATPWKQQVMQVVGVVSAALIMAPVLNLLLTAYGMGPPTAEQPESLAAPQATLMASVASGVLGGDLPWGIVAVGAALAAGIVGIDVMLQRRGSAVRVPVLAVAVGIYLPLELSVPIAAGGAIAALAARAGAPAGKGMLFAAGLITGEALVGIFLAIPIGITGDSAVLALPSDWRFGTIAGLAMLLGVMLLLYRSATQQSTSH